MSFTSLIDPSRIKSLHVNIPELQDSRCWTQRTVRLSLLKCPLLVDTRILRGFNKNY